MIDFSPVSINDKALYEKYSAFTKNRGCEHTFANLIMWGEQKIAEVDGMLLRLSFYEGHYSYAFPIGQGDIKAVIDRIIEDAQSRNIPCSFFSVYEKDAELLQKLYPHRFAIIKSRDGFDYIYDINNLADLKGRKYHSKRNHLHRFYEVCTNTEYEVLTKENLHLAKKLADNWYDEKLRENPDSDFELEQIALARAFENYDALSMEGLLLKCSGEILAFTMGSKMTDTTFDVHFEKAISPAAYVAINNAFAKHIRDKYPEILYLDREEDMGLAGLRKAKESYHPTLRKEKYRAVLIDKNLRPVCPKDTDRKKLWKLWQEAFGDCEEVLQTFWDTAYNANRCRCILSDSEALAALYIFDCTHSGEKLAYIYAVATAKSHRGQGLCTLLMADTHSYLKENGYKGAVLVPACENLFAFYENMGYTVCAKADEYEVSASDTEVPLQEIPACEYAALRKLYLDEGAVIQEGENLEFLSTYAKFYKGEDFILCAYTHGDKLIIPELLGNTSLAAHIVTTLGFKGALVRAKGKEKPFAMYYPFHSSYKNTPTYFCFAFD